MKMVIIHLEDMCKQVNQTMKLNMSQNNNIELRWRIQSKVVGHAILKFIRVIKIRLLKKSSRTVLQLKSNKIRKIVRK